MQTQQAYELNEARAFNLALTVPHLTRQERQEARAEWLNTMQTQPALIGERVAWLLNGSYGYGSYQAARRMLAASKRTNVAAWCGITIAALEWQTHSRDARAAWHMLTDAQRTTVTATIQAAIDGERADMAAEAEYQATKANG